MRNVVLIAAQALSMTIAWAADYPVKPVRVIVSSIAGSANDVLVRLAAPRVAERLGQPMLVDNRGGAAGVVGSELVARAAADGYTLLLSSLASQVIAPVVQKTPYDGLRDFTHIAVLGGCCVTTCLAPAKRMPNDATSPSMRCTTTMRSPARSRRAATRPIRCRAAPIC